MNLPFRQTTIYLIVPSPAYLPLSYTFGQCLRQQSVTYLRTHHCLPHILCRFPLQRLMHMHHECEEYQQKPWCYAKYFSRQTSCTSGIPLNTQLTIPISLYPSLWYRFLAPAFRALVSMRKATQLCSFA